jgi:hypothetical protein
VSDHARPDGVDDTTVEAAALVSEALEWAERARGRLHDLHHLIGRADFVAEEAVEKLRAAGHPELAQFVAEEIVGRNVLEGRWTFQILEEFDRVYYEPFREAERRVRDELVHGRRHIFESELKEQRRTAGRRHHESRPGSEG